jgi:hypothetical protein
MKTILTIILTYISGLCFSQNWSVFNKNYRYNYSLENEGFTTVVIFADSVIVQGTDTIYSLNRIAAKCDSCWFYYPEPGVADSNYILINQPQFMQRRIVFANDQYRLSDTGNYVLPRFSSAGSSWMFNASRNITAQHTSSSLKTCFSVTDSVKTILLSTSDTILISKQFGIIKYPAKFGQQVYYKLRGIENDTIYDVNALYGEKVPNYYDFFKLKPGVIHYYSATSSAAGFINQCYSYYYARKTITSSSITGTVAYNSYVEDRKGCAGNCLGGLGGFCWISNPSTFPSLPVNTYTNNNVATYQQYWDHFYTAYNNQAVFPQTGLGQNIYVVKFGKTANDHFYKTYGYSCFSGYLTERKDSYSNFSYQPSTLNPIVFYTKDFSGISIGVGETFIEGYGEVNLLFPAFETNNYYCTSAIIDGADTLGDITATNIVTSLKNEERDHSSFGPNPAKDLVTIHFPAEASGSKGTIEVRDICGKLISQRTITDGSASEKVSLQNLAQGIYFIDVKTPHFQKQFKVIKEE